MMIIYKLYCVSVYIKNFGMGEENGGNTYSHACTHFQNHIILSDYLKRDLFEKYFTDKIGNKCVETNL